MGRGRVVLLLCALVLCACRSRRVEYVSAVGWHTDTLVRTVLRSDSVWVHDSVHVREGKDTVWMERWHTRHSLREVRDTLYRVRTDSVPKPYPVERALNRWERAKQDWGGVAMVLLAVSVLSLVWRLARRCGL